MWKNAIIMLQRLFFETAGFKIETKTSVVDLHVVR